MSEHTPGAMRAANRILDRDESARITADELAAIIDAETGLKELIGAIWPAEHDLHHGDFCGKDCPHVDCTLAKVRAAIDKCRP